jgi:hypothetical protein
MLEARDKGMVGVTLRYPYEVRRAEDYFDVIEDEKVPKDMLDLAVHIFESKKGRFEPEKFEDEYENGLKELLRKKQKGERIERPKEPARTNVVNLMDALRRSVGQEKRTPASAKKGRKRVAAQTEMLLPITGKKGKGSRGRSAGWATEEVSVLCVPERSRIFVAWWTLATGRFNPTVPRTRQGAVRHRSVVATRLRTLCWLAPPALGARPLPRTRPSAAETPRRPVGKPC